jgi:hypothetical protein
LLRQWSERQWRCPDENVERENERLRKEVHLLREKREVLQELGLEVGHPLPSNA